MLPDAPATTQTRSFSVIGARGGSEPISTAEIPDREISHASSPPTSCDFDRMDGVLQQTASWPKDVLRWVVSGAAIHTLQMCQSIAVRQVMWHRVMLCRAIPHTANRWRISRHRRNG